MARYIGTKKLEKFTANELINKYVICGKWADRLRQMFPRNTLFTLAGLLNINDITDYGSMIYRIYMSIQDKELRGLNCNNAIKIDKEYTWSDEPNATLMGIAWMILENGYDL